MYVNKISLMFENPTFFSKNFKFWILTTTEWEVWQAISRKNTTISKVYRKPNEKQRVSSWKGTK